MKWKINELKKVIKTHFRDYNNRKFLFIKELETVATKKRLEKVRGH